MKLILTKKLLKLRFGNIFPPIENIELLKHFQTAHKVIQHFQTAGTACINLSVYSLTLYNLAWIVKYVLYYQWLPAT